MPALFVGHGNLMLAIEDNTSLVLLGKMGIPFHGCLDRAERESKNTCKPIH
jgi:hypothetical protein